MKSLLYIILLLSVFAFSACSDNAKPPKKVEVKKVMAYFNDSITPKVIWEYVEGDTTDIVASHYYKNGILQMKGHVLHGARDGKWVAWDQEGRMLSTGFYTDGLENGMWTVWFPSGVKRYEGLFKDGERSGLWKFYDANGRIVKEIEY